MRSHAVQAVSRAVLAPTLIIAAATLVKGYSDTGDGFAAGVIAALGVVLQYVAFDVWHVERRLPVRHAPTLAITGLLTSLAVAFAPVLAGRALLQHVPGPGEAVTYVGSLELITPVLFDLGIFMLVLGTVVSIVRLLALADAEQPGAEAV